MGKKNKPIVVHSFDDFKLNKIHRKGFAKELKKAESGDIRAWEEVGASYMVGLGVERDSDKAYDCFQKCDVRAGWWESLGFNYSCGLGCEINMDRAVECYRKAAAMGNEDAKAALIELGLE